MKRPMASGSPRHKQSVSDKQNKSISIRIFVDGAGARPDGTGSGFAWLREDTGETKVQYQEKLTNNQAEYMSILSAVQSVPKCSGIEILADSQLAICQLNGQYRILDPDLADLAKRVRAIVEKKKLRVTFTWIPRTRNRADKLLLH